MCFEARAQNNVLGIEGVIPLLSYTSDSLENGFKTKKPGWAYSYLYQRRLGAGLRAGARITLVSLPDLAMTQEAVIADREFGTPYFFAPGLGLGWVNVVAAQKVVKVNDTINSGVHYNGSGFSLSPRISAGHSRGSFLFSCFAEYQFFFGGTDGLGAFTSLYLGVTLGAQF